MGTVIRITPERGGRPGGGPSGHPYANEKQKHYDTQRHARQPKQNEGHWFSSQ